MDKFKVGDTVVIKEKADKVWKKYGRISHFQSFLGKQSKVISVSINDEQTWYSLENSSWTWFEDELKPILSEIRKMKLNKIKNV